MNILQKGKRFFASLDGSRGEAINSIEDYKERKRRRRKTAALLMGGAAVLLLLLILLIWNIVERWEYDAYKVTAVMEQEDTLSTNYVEFNDNILKVGSDEVSLLNRQGDALWKAAQSMNSPQTDICQEYCVVYDKNGSTMMLYDYEGKQGEIKTNLPILKAKVSKQGVVAAVLADGENTWINVYSKDGQEIVNGKTRVDSPGYPADLSISEDGLLLAVSYLCVENGQPASFVAFYNFGSSGQNQMDNMVSGYTYEGTLVPAISFMGNSRLVAFRDDGFAIFQGKQIPEEKVIKEMEQEILSVFCDESYIGLVFKEQEEDYAYRIELYSKDGDLKWTCGTDIAFDQIRIGKGRILLYNNSEFAVFTMRGHCRYTGSFKDGQIRNMFKTGKNEFLVVTDQGLKTIKLT